MGWSSQVILANKVVVFGPGDGVFVYTGTPRPGNPPVAWMGSGNIDPYGNTLPSTAGVRGIGTFAADTPSGARVTLQNGQLLIRDSALNQWTTQAEVLSGTPYLVLNLGSQSVYLNQGGYWQTSDPAVPAQPETWHPVTLPAGVTGTIRVKILPMANMAVLDVNVTIASTLAAGTSYAGGSLPSAAYYPVTAVQPPLAVNQGMAASPASPRVLIPTAGAIALQMPGFTTAGTTCNVWGTVVYPLD